MAGIYIHIPFCKKACTYCNFHFSTSVSLKHEFVQALVKEILMVQSFIDRSEKIETVYFGGGTPSLLSADELKMIFEALHKHFDILEDAEITFEANPDDISERSLSDWRQNGINRLSLGIQSFDDAELKWMNRVHDASESLATFDKIKDAGFTNYSIDLIFGSPLSDKERLQKNLDIIFKEQVPHISCYALTVEPKTALAKMIKDQRSKTVDSDSQADQFMIVMNSMKVNGYEHYEISNYAMDGMRSKHNSSYWHGVPYHGFGPSAHSFNGDSKRRWNITNNNLYIQSIAAGIIPFEEEVLTTTQRLNEIIMTSIRTKEGISISEISDRFGEKYASELMQNALQFTGNKIEFNNGRLWLTNEGKLFADAIAAELFFEV